MKEKVWLPLESIDIKGLEFPDWCWQIPFHGKGRPDA